MSLNNYTPMGEDESEVFAGKANLFRPRRRAGLPVEGAIHDLPHPLKPPLRIAQGDAAGGVHRRASARGSKAQF
jgi:hypothetical protein